MHERGPHAPARCIACGAPIDRLRDPARIVNGRLAGVCKPCADASDLYEHDELDVLDGPEIPRVRCSCGALVEIHDIRPVIALDGSVAKRCSMCPYPADGAVDVGAGDGARMARAHAIEPPGMHREAQAAPLPARLRRHAIAVAAAAVVVAFAIHGRDRIPASATVARSFAPAALAGTVAPSELAARVTRRDSAPAPEVDADGDADLGEGLGEGDAGEPSGENGGEPAPTVEDLLEGSDESLEERLPTLADWVHPVPGSTETYPLKASRRFGAERDGVTRAECGRGHCGMDLDGPRGTPVVAVAWGIVVRIEQRSSRRSGKYVRIEHPDFVYTSYMHLDAIAPGLRVGDEVRPGEPIGTLGRTGIFHSAPHLHFSLEIPHEDRLVYVDPEAFLRRATRLEEIPELEPPAAE